MYVSRLYNEIPPMAPSPRPHTDVFLDASPIFSPDQDGVTFLCHEDTKTWRGAVGQVLGPYSHHQG